METISVTDLEVLRKLILELDLPYEVGEVTPPDGSCFLHAIRQNMVYLTSIDLWNGGYPNNVQKLREDVIIYWRSKKDEWTQPQFNQDTGVYEDPILTEEQFENLLQDQSRDHSYTDNFGHMVKILCSYLNIELRIVVTQAGNQIQESGVGGPYLKINQETPTSKRAAVFHVGLLKDQTHFQGHYQFLKQIYDNSSQRPEGIKFY